MIVEYDHEHSFVGPFMSLSGPGWGSIRLRSASIDAHGVAARVQGEEE